VTGRSRFAAFGSAFALVSFVGCRAKSGEAVGTPSSAGAPVTEAPPAPLDTSWERDPGHQLQAGEAAPDFEGIAHTGMRVRLSAFLARPVVVYFYKGDKTAEGTAEARGFRDAWLRILPVAGMVLGVSADDRVQHRDFATAEELPFLLVADESQKIARAFGVPSEGGRSHPVTFVVGKDGKIAHVFAEPTVDGHAAEVLTFLQSLK
jgi:peroxiredoxin Q/BCP